ncbi:ABC transporter permease [Dyadobacter pollutisoli]|uniref:ABC transporter permease n=1 Tax=Dyadobacter pollutisoli TaxID=2910158 RepID=A0A9E8NEN6_9BACT|nr:ABC transporter permease [Dyadobacter pollutisoli]WAC13581.1 ABC transporter permease [Dyadobacter pollutisoli]
MKPNHIQKPPKWATWLLHCLCADHLMEEMDGDLEELFYQRVKSVGVTKARFRYVIDVFSMLRPFAFKKKKNTYPQFTYTQPAMIRNNFKIAFRNLWKHKAFTFINVMGLTVGMSACFLIALYVHFELSYDGFNKKADRIYRLATDLKTTSETLNYSISSWAFGPNLKNEFEEVEAFTRISTRNYLVRKGDLKFKEEKTVFADSSLFNVFDFELIKGDPKTALKDQMSIVFTEKTAKKYFGDADPIGQTLLLGDEGIPATVTGVMKEAPANSQIKGDLFVSMSSYTQRFNKGVDTDWGNFGTTTYLLLNPGVKTEKLAAKFPPFLEKHAGQMMRENKMAITFVMEPLLDIYLHSKREAEESGSMNNVYIFSVVAIFILLIACINFINLTTARSAERAREVGVRKAVGAARSLLRRQFIIESVLLCTIAFVFSVVLSAISIPFFNDLSGKIISTGIADNPQFVACLFLAALLIGCLAGIYPAFVLSSFDPIVVLKGRFTMSAKGNLLRKGLVTVQFAVSIALIIATIVVYKQVNFMRSRDLGFSKDQMLVINGETDKKRNVFQESLLNISGVKSTAASTRVPGSKNNEAYSEIENARGEMQSGNLEVYSVDFNFLQQFDLKIIAGRAFSKAFGSDSSKALVINEAAARMLGYQSPQEAIGRKYKQWGRQGTIIGVVKDFHFKSLQENITPLTFRFLDFWNGDLVSVKIEGNHVRQTLASIEKEWKAQNPEKPFTYYFMDEYFDRQYRADERFERLFLDFAVLAIFISCLGLLGLASYSTMQRTKEIGVRKVMGASTGSIVGLLSKDFLKLVSLAFLIASPLAWFGMRKWLQNFAYQTDIEWWVFAVAAILSGTIAFATISFQSIKAAFMNPIKSLRSE